ncbi:uncharacterized protein K02A2.6-like isoform X2 [Plutella xylostella]|uniref:uncharacterized protein K02A2.6-like isoform X2 n=1 Tax=Plutella xylostella TaxID=51655 RepID=UPI0020324476|nr:uncharacterized protein K02A2.6-like isoform X2 [Plutella xylostella]
MSFLGSISNFDHKTGEWSIFKGRLQQFIKINNFSVSNQSAVLITHLSDETYRLLRNLVYPKDLDNLSYEELIKVLDNHFITKRCTFADKARFYGATRSPGETLGDWAARLRGLASYCDFDSALEMVLRDRFVLGLGLGPERDKLFEQSASTLTFSSALQIAEQAESARQAKAMVMDGAGASVKQEPVYRAASERARRDGGAGAAGGAPAAARSVYQRDIEEGLRCSVCGLKNHSSEKCRYKNSRCKKCGKKGHMKKLCKVRVNNLDMEDQSNSDCDDCKECMMYNLRYETYPPITVCVDINSNTFNMELDSGSAISVISELFYTKNFPTVVLNESLIKICVYNGHKIKPLGYFTARITYEDKCEEIKLYVIKNGGPPLLGRDFLSKFSLQFTTARNNNIEINDDYENDAKQIATEFSDLWKDELGTFNKFKVTLRLKDNVQPKFFKPRNVPFALKEKVNDELKRLTSLGILVPVTNSDYATPIVPVLKENGKVRIAGDYSITLNKDMHIDKYPMPRIEEVFANIGGGERYTKIDLSNAYNQFVLSDDSQELTTINTPRGLFKYTRLVYGLANAPAIFQRTMENLLSGIDGVSCWLDDVCVTAPSREEHLRRLREVLARFKNAGLKLQKQKCEFFQQSITYLGYVIDKHGVRTCPKKVEAILAAPRPNNVSDLKRFLGIINYYRNFVPRISSILCPLYELLRKDAEWVWSGQHEQAMRQVQRALAADVALAHYEPGARLVLAVDAGPGGLGAVLAQGAEGHERPLAFASRSLAPSEKNYSQIHKEATAIIFAVKYFHQYLYGRNIPFVLKTDHKPLIAIFGKNKGVSVMTASRLQRYAIFLSAYNYDIQYVSSEKNLVADYCSRAPIDSKISGTDLGENGSYLNYIKNDNLPLLFTDMQAATSSDKVLQTVIKYMRNGWPRKIKCKQILPYFKCKSDLDVDDGCLLRGHRLIIPQVHRERMLIELHKGHLGVVKTKSLARSKMWWPGIDGDITRTVLACDTCSALRAAPPRAPPAAWPPGRAPWDRLHIDYMELDRKVFLVVIGTITETVTNEDFVDCENVVNEDECIVRSEVSAAPPAPPPEQPAGPGPAAETEGPPPTEGGDREGSGGNHHKYNLRPRKEVHYKQ